MVVCFNRPPSSDSTNIMWYQQFELITKYRYGIPNFITDPLWHDWVETIEIHGKLVERLNKALIELQG